MTAQINEQQVKSEPWLKKNIFLLIIILIISIYFFIKIENLFIKIENLNITFSNSIVPTSAILDFQNKHGTTKIQSSFSEILISSEGSKKKGDGYIVILKIINTSSVTLKEIECTFKPTDSYESVQFSDIKFSLSPGKSKNVRCFISNLSDISLKSIEVFVYFNKVSFFN